MKQRFVYPNDGPFNHNFNWASIFHFLRFMMPYRKQLIGVTALALLGSVTQVLAPAIIAIAIDKAIQPRDGEASIRLLLMYASLMIVLCVLQMAVGRYRIRRMSRIGQQMISDLRSTLFSRIQSLPIRYFNSKPTGSIHQHITGDIAVLEDIIMNGTITLLMDILQLVGVITILLIWNYKLGALIMLTVPLVFAVSRFLRKRIRVSFQELRAKQACINAHLNDSIQGMKVTQAYEQEEENIRYFESINKDNIRAWDKASALNQLLIPVIQLTIVLGLIILFVYGSYLIQTGVMTVGLFVGYTNYIFNFWEPVQRIGQLYSQLLIGMASSDKIFGIIRQESADPEVEAKENISIKGEIAFEQVSFQYDNNKMALQEIDLTIKAGQMAAFVGSTGAGKSTLINLLCRFYDPDQGRVLIDGTDIRNIANDNLRSQICLVPQEPFIFSGTIRDNIRYGKLDATDEEVKLAATAVHAHDFIMRLPQGYDTPLQEQGGMLSTGQKQLISFARAIIANPRILILDEATANIDTETERNIQQALKALQLDRTTVVVAHRLSTIRDADQIFVLDHGKLIEQGTHQQLVHHVGSYRQFIEMQRYLAVGE